MIKVTSETVANYITSLRLEFPDLEIRKGKPSWLSFISKFPLIKNLNWGDATQTIGMNIWLSDRWDEYSPADKMSTLRHERIHLLQFRKYGLFPMALLYLFCFFPIGLAWYRAKFERAAFAESVKAQVKYHGGNPTTKNNCREMYIRAFSGATYLWPWPFRKQILRWFKEDWQKAVRSW